MSAFETQNLPLIGTVLDAFCALVSNFQIYGLEHPRAVSSLEHYQEQRARIVELPGMRGRDLVIAIHSGRLYLENMPLPPRRQNQSLLDLIAEQGMAGFELNLSLDDAGLEAVLRHLTDRRSANRTADIPGFRWLGADEVHARVTSSAHLSRGCTLLEGLDGCRFDFDFCDQLLNDLAGFTDSCSRNDTGNITPLIEAANGLVGRLQGDDDGLLAATTVPYHDHYTYHHTLNVAVVTVSCAQLVVSSPAELRRIAQAALLYDIGKSRIPEEILCKPDRLTQSEAAIVMTHPVEGAAMLTRFPQVDPLSVLVAFGHHIKDDDSGYPKVSGKFHLDPVTKLVEVVDIFEALTAERPFKRALSQADAFEVIYSMPSMTSFHPFIDLVARVVGLHRVGARVRLQDGATGVIVGRDADHPENLHVQRIVRTAREQAELTGEVVTDVTAGSLSALDPDEDRQLLGVN